jgi:hypothetical protein
MAVRAPLITSAAYLRGTNGPHFLTSKSRFGLQSPTKQLALTIVAMAPQKKVTDQFNSLPRNPLQLLPLGSLLTNSDFKILSLAHYFQLKQYLHTYRLTSMMGTGRNNGTVQGSFTKTAKKSNLTYSKSLRNVKSLAT